MDRLYVHKSSLLFSSKFILSALLSVFTGGFIYILFRPAPPDFFNYFSKTGLDIWLVNTREKSLFFYNFLPEWVVFSLPGALWAFAYTSIILSIWIGSGSFLKYFWYLSIPVLIFGFEILQLTGNIPGTFCTVDLIWSTIGIIIGSLLVSVEWKQYQKRNHSNI